MTQFDEPHKLLKAIEAWYDQNGSGTPIPGDDCGNEALSKAFAETFNNFSNHTVDYGSGDILEVSGNILPLLAGIKLGFSLETLKEIILHHDIDVDEIARIDFPDDMANDDPVLKHRNGTGCSKIDFITTVFQAMNLINSRQLQMNHASDAKSLVQLGFLHTNNEECWPAHHIKVRAAAVQQTDTKGAKNLSAPNQDFAYIITNLTDESSLPNSSPMDFLNRVGMLLPETAKRSTAHYALWEEMAELSLKGNQCCTKVLEYCANHPNPDIQKQVKQALLSLGGYQHMEDAGEMHNHLRSIFGNDTYRDVLGKVIPRINLVPFDPDDFLAYFPEDPDYCDFLNHKETLLSVVAKEVLEQPAEDLGYNQLNAFAKLKYLELPAQRIEGFIPETLINHMVDGIRAYAAKLPLVNCHKSRMDAEVKSSLADLITLVQLHHKIDYAAFDHRTSSEKALLVEAGFSIHDMTGLTYQDKGYIFTRELGV
jgi:hypothetical protein